MDKSVETSRMVKLEVPYKLCFTVGKNVFIKIMIQCKFVMVP